MTAPPHPEVVLRESFGLTLPAVQTPRASYLKASRSGDLLFLSGHGTRQNGEPAFSGKLGRELDVEQGQRAAQVAALNLLATIKQQLGDLDNVARFLKLLCFVNSDPGFTATPAVADGASDLLVAIFGHDRGAHARAAIGVATLPSGMAVEIEGIVQCR